ncbi:hypothetical protein C8F01DRAFT_1254868 [Mycena amicta]|nr:hypothetical protein C8F01DRAFT_1254868 [Mycena amicta]
MTDADDLSRQIQQLRLNGRAKQQEERHISRSPASPSGQAGTPAPAAVWPVLLSACAPIHAAVWRIIIIILFSSTTTAAVWPVFLSACTPIHAAVWRIVISISVSSTTTASKFPSCFGVVVRAAAVQREPGGSAIALRKNRCKRSSKKFRAYAVIRGHQIGVYTSWSLVEAQIRGFSFSLQFGCRSVEEAQALLEFATAKGWTSTSTTFRSRPVSLSKVPSPCRSADDIHGRPPRKADDPWYICYVGVHPGVYSSYLECALNTLGVPDNLHDHRDTFDDAMDEFLWAQLDGRVVAHDS